MSDLIVALTATSSWVPWWEQVAPGESITVTVTYAGAGEFGLLAGVGGTPAKWLINRRTRSGRLTVSLPATTGGLWRIGVNRFTGSCSATVTVTAAKPSMPNALSTGGDVPLYRLTQHLGSLPAGTVVRRKGEVITGGDYLALRGGLPAGAQLFDPTSNVFRVRADVHTGELHPQNDAIVAEFTRQVGVGNGGNAYLNTYQYNANTFLIAPGTPTVEVLYKPWQPGIPKLRMWDTFNQVPWPTNAVPSLGNDRAVVLYRPDTRELWEFWKVRPKPGRPGSENYYNSPYDEVIGGEIQASHGGYIADASLSRGVFDDDQYGYHYGTSATSISYAGSAITVADVASGEIDHALAVQTIFAAPYSQFYWPALRSDGGTSGNPIREGQRFRFPADLDVDAISGLNTLSRMIVRAIQKYGLIVTDKAGAVSLVTESGGVMIRDDGSNVDTWWSYMNGLGGARSYNVLRNVPWGLLQALPVDYGKPN